MMIKMIFEFEFAVICVLKHCVTKSVVKASKYKAQKLKEYLHLEAILARSAILKLLFVYITINNINKISSNMLKQVIIT